jgi:Zn-dependent protease
MSGDPYREYRPIQPRGGFDWKRLLSRIWAPLAFVGGLALKFGFVFVKFAGLFVSIGAYALIWGWQWGVGFVALIFVHELGHMLEAKRQGLEVSWPTFIPFFGAYVTYKSAGLTPWRNALIALAGPFVGGLGAAACWAIGENQGSQLFSALGFSGFLLNLFNLIPIGFLDGGAIARAASESWRMPRIRFEDGVPFQAPPDRQHGVIIAVLYFALVALLVLGMWKSHVPQNRL